MSEEIHLHEILSNDAILEIARGLRNLIFLENIRDYASLIELEAAETKLDFLEAIKRFQRRYISAINRLKKEEKLLKKISEEALINIGKLVDDYGIKLVKTALIALALCKSEKSSKPT